VRDFVIRPALIEDLDDCVWFDQQEALSPALDERKRAMIESRIFTQDVLLAVDGAGKPVGYIRFDHLWPMMMPSLGWVYVKPEWRGSGVMAALYQTSIDLMIERGYRKILLSTQANRTDVADLFKSMGMKECGRLSIHGTDKPSEVFFLCEI
jgi:ribosomal protein S18 acetylase RimI-like enzyme